MRKYRIDCIVGARPNFMKIAPILRALAACHCQTRLIHTGQHYDAAMNDVFFDELGIPLPDINLDVGPGSGTDQTARIMQRLERVFLTGKPHAVVVVGDINSTMAAALVAAKMQVAIVHIEAGLRSFDRAMPEEINRLVTDRLSDLLLATEQSAIANLLHEGVAPDRIKMVGNVMIDTMHHNLHRAVPADETLKSGPDGISPDRFGLVTLHRPSNVDDPRQLERLLTALIDISFDLDLVFPMHPRTKAMIGAMGILERLNHDRILVTPPLGYLRMLGLMRQSRVVITDSGGIQEETTALGIPCLTVRDTTERPVTIAEGTNTLVGSDPAKLADAVRHTLATGGKRGRTPPLWDGHAANRIVSEIKSFLERASTAAPVNAAA